MNLSKRFPYLTICDHPLIQHKLTHMRNYQTSTKVFRQLLYEISLLIGFDITRDFELVSCAIKTPLALMDSPVILGRKLVIVPILRAGIGMSNGLLELMPNARSGHIGIYRNKQCEAIEYFVKLPSIEGRKFILCDPMLATGHTIKHAIDILIARGVAIDHISVMTLVAVPEGLDCIYDAYPTLRIFTAAVDKYLDEHAYIIPGLGDAGDRLFGTSDK